MMPHPFEALIPEYERFRADGGAWPPGGVQSGNPTLLDFESWLAERNALPEPVVAVSVPAEVDDDKSETEPRKRRSRRGKADE